MAFLGLLERFIMQINIDWFSFTLKRAADNDDTEPRVLSQVYDLLTERYPDWFEAFGGLTGWTWQPGKKPYRASYRSPDSGISIWVHPALDHVMVEMTGKGCARLGEWHDASGFIAAFQDRCNRLDLACDMLTDATPSEFVQQRQPGRFKSDGHINEESGSTEYVGSRKSNRFACVYRYNPPHERSHLLRCEFRVRAEDAKATCASILQNGHLSVADALGRAFGWEHPEWRVEAPTEIELRAYRPDRKKGNTLFWLNDTVAPLLRRLHLAGDIDATEWLHQMVLQDTMLIDDLS